MFRRKYLPLWPFVMIIAGILTLQAQQESKTANERVREISGIVVNESGQPMPGVGVFISSSSQQSIKTTTAADGSFKVGGLEQAIYTVLAYAPTYVNLFRNPSDPTNYYAPGDSIRLKLVKGSVLTGTVTTSSGEPVIGVTVRAFLVRDQDGHVPSFRMQQAGERTTDDRGVYRIYGLPAGSYLVAAGGSYDDPNSLSAYDYDAPTYAPSSNRDTGAEFVVGPGEELANVDIKYRAEPGHKISGTAKARDANSSFSITLSSSSTGTSVRSSFQSAESRGFMFTGVPDDTYDVSATSNSGDVVGLSDPIKVAVKGMDVTGLELLTKPLASIAGRFLLVNSKAPECAGNRPLSFAEVLVTALREGQKTQTDAFANMYFSGSPTVPEKDGNFIFRNLRPGKYSIIPRMFARYWYVQSIKLPAAVQSTGAALGNAGRSGVELKSGDRVNGVTINLAEGAASVRGSIVTTDSENRPSNLYLYLVPVERESADDPLRFFAVQIEHDGKFAINNLPPGRYWALIRTAADKEMKLVQSPGESETRAKILREAEATRSAIELKPCQNIPDYKLTLKSVSVLRYLQSTIKRLV
ncbi:MAG TPA: carboxypeptidase-like regulatory domain-containing protein [Pyrinomonadaceae bacterium]